MDFLSHRHRRQLVFGFFHPLHGRLASAYQRLVLSLAAFSLKVLTMQAAESGLRGQSACDLDYR